MANFIVQFPLLTEIYQDDILDKRFETARKMYNALANKAGKRYREMIKTKIYRHIKAELSTLHKQHPADKLPPMDRQYRNELYDQLNGLYQQFGITEYAFHADVKTMQHHFKKVMDSSTAQKIASTLWNAYKKLLFGDGETVHFKRYGTLNSLEGKSNKTGIRFKNNRLLWKGLKIPVQIKNTPYEQQALQNEIAYCRIVRKFIKNKYRFYVQIVFKGTPPLKLTPDGHLKNQMGIGDVGLDIGTQTIAIASCTNLKIYELADRITNIENKKRKLLRKLDRSRRQNNPDNFNPDGTIKKQGNKKVKWVRSKRYQKIQNELKELYRKQADIRKYQHECLANEIIAQGDRIYVETMSFKGLQKRAKKTTINEKTGKFNKKTRYGKSLGNKAPAMLLSILDRKLKTVGNKLIKIDTWSVKASQYDHDEDTCKKKKLSQRWTIVAGKNIQRDLYSAFLIQNVNSDLKSINRNKCTTRFDAFVEQHANEVKRLQGRKNLSSIAI